MAFTDDNMIDTHDDHIGDVRWLRPASSGQGDIFSRLWLPGGGADDEADCAKTLSLRPPSRNPLRNSNGFRVEPGMTTPFSHSPAPAPRAIIQIAHGMAEHSARYDDFARFLTGKGFLVCMNDHAGHGAHADRTGTLGYFADSDGPEFVTQDMQSLFDAVTARDPRFPSLPKFLLGHSMGSFLARKYITKYGAELAGCILSGTMGSNPALAVGKTLAAIQVKVKGPKSPGKLLSQIAFGSSNKRIENPVSGNAWLSTVDEVCRVYDDDPYCGFQFTALGFYDLFSIMQEITASGWAASVPKTLPIYIFSGGEDPVGAYGKGVEEVYDRLKKTGHEDLTLKIYPGGRHEMLNEVNHEEVYEDVLAWINTHG
jgi:alpha-beta hydrolase superfamily lysophospholipase